MEVILDFCAECGILLPAGLGLEPSPTCPNCNTIVKPRSSRAQGTFSEEDAEKLGRLRGGV